MEQVKKFTKIKGLSSVRRLPREGKIRLGVKVISAKSGKEYPKEVDYFVVPEKVARIYGTDKPTEIDVMFPVNDPEKVFPQSYKAYGSDQRLKCKGDGETAIRWTEKGEQEITCPCDWLEDRKCAKRAHLMVFLPRVSLGGVYQIDTGSGANIIMINSYMDYLLSLIGRIAMIPLKLIREPQKVQHDGKTDTHYLLRFEYQGDINEINRLRENTQQILARTSNLMLETPKEDGGEDDTPIVIEEVEEDKNKTSEDTIGESDEKLTKPDENEAIIPKPITRQHQLTINQLTKDLKIKSKAIALKILSGITGREIKATADLTLTEANRVIDLLLMAKNKEEEALDFIEKIKQEQH